MKTPSHIMSLEFSCLDELWRVASPAGEPIDDLNHEILGYFAAPGTKPIEKGRSYTAIAEMPSHLFVRQGIVMGVYASPNHLLVRPLLEGPTPCLALETCHTGGSYAYDSEQDHLVVLHTDNSRVSVYDMQTGVFLRLYVVGGIVVNGDKTNVICVDNLLLMTTLTGNNASSNAIFLGGEGIYRRAHLWWHAMVSPAMDRPPALTHVSGRVKMAWVDPKKNSIIMTYFVLRRGLRSHVLKEKEVALQCGGTDVSTNLKSIWFFGEQWLGMCDTKDGITSLRVADESQSVCIATGTNHYRFALEASNDTLLALYSAKEDSKCGTLLTYFF